ncbi:MAG: family 43 glycosylhydrolase [Acidimicrobiales bacterium]|nr:family 43 glycosylhydrolase [Acidimicrobiales bacterium]
MPRRRARALVVAPALALLAVAATACTPLGSPATRQTPAAPRVWDASDPAVLVVGTDAYLFGSTNNKKVPVRQVQAFDGSLADSKAAWDAVYSPASQNDAMPTRPAWVNPTRFGGTWHIWAPSAVKIGPNYYLYFAASRSGATDTHNDQCIGRAVASSPMGPYSPGPDPLYCGLPAEAGSNPWGRGALDPEVFRAPGGDLFLLVSMSRTEDSIGVLPLRSDGRIPGGTNARPTTLVSKQFPWHDGSDDSTLNRSQGTLENPSMVHEPKTDTYLLFYSAGRWDSAYYNTGFARCATPTGPCTKQSDGPFLKSGNGRTGVGGLTAFTMSDGQLRVAYSSWKAGKEPPNNTPNPDGSLSRQTHWQRISVTDTSSASAQSVRLVD